MSNWKLILISIALVIFAGCSGDYTVEDGVDVNIQDQTTEIIDLKVTQLISNVTLLQNYNINQEHINISSLVTPQIDDYICFKDVDGIAFLQTEIQNVISLGGNNYQVELEMSLDFPYTINDSVSLRNVNMAVDGSTTKQIFSITPIGLLDNTTWHITRLICAATGDGVSTQSPIPDDTSFLTTESTTHGIYFRYSNNERYKNLFYAKNNFEIRERVYDLNINTELNKDGLYSTTFRRTFGGADKNGVVIELSANESSNNFHRFDVIIDRDLTDLDEFECVVQGHVTKY